MDESSVRVALRIRPPIARELIDDCQLCTSVTPNLPQVWIGGNYAFTYDYVFDVDSNQESIFETVRGLIDGCMDGYNATILAYGQTGSGKTYTMGTGFDVETHHSVQVSESQGIIPRAVHYLFNSIQARRDGAISASETPPDFSVTAQFVELYNEEVIDLIDPDIMAKSGRKGPGTILIREDPTGGIYLVGVGSKTVLTAEDAMNCLHQGALSRTTATTNMNDQSSRSHAIYTLHIKQKRILHSNVDEMDTDSISEFETLTAKFHFVDLAGSERLKRTGAVGDRAKEGISINSGLLSLGNVISALGDRSKKSSHIPYRDSKLTRLLQDSLGGNSRTIVIACVSPCDRDFLETLNTLKYANRARNIKNKVTVNQDKSSSTIAHLKAQVQQLELELQEYKQGKRAISDVGDEIETDTYHENILLHTELTTLKGRVKALQGTVETLTAKNAQLLAERATGTWNMSDNKADLGSHCDLTVMVQTYLEEIEKLGAKLYESEATCEQLRTKIDKFSVSGFNNSLSPRPLMSSMTTSSAYNDMETMEPISTSVVNLLDQAKKEVEVGKQIVRKLRKRGNDRTGMQNEDNNESSDERETDESSDDEDDDVDEAEAEEDFEAQLAHLTNEIGTKQRLIDELELSQKRMEALKAQYEEKLKCLSSRIKATEEERDKVLNSMHQQKTTPQGKIMQVKDDYEKKLVGMQTELKKWQSASKEHQKRLRKEGQHERQIVSLHNEMENMKRTKVRLMNQLKEENSKRRDIESQRNKEIVQLKKSQRKKDIAIRTLETQNRMKEQVLKRKHEELNALKKLGRSAVLNRKESSRTPVSVSSLKRFSPIKAKQKWCSLRSTLRKTVSLKQTIENLEKDMIYQINERRKVKAEMEMLIEERQLKQNQMANPVVMNDINDQIESTESALQFLDEKISDCQRDMVELVSTNSKEEEDGSIPKIIAALNKEECGYIMEKMYQQMFDELIDSSNCIRFSQALQQDVLKLNNENKKLREMLIYTHSSALLDELPPEFVHELNNIRSALDDNYSPLAASLKRSTLESTDINTGDNHNEIVSKSYPSSPMVRRNLLNGNYYEEGYHSQFQQPGSLESGAGIRKSRRLTASSKEFLEGNGSIFRNPRPQATITSMDDTENDLHYLVEIPQPTNFNRANSLRGPPRFQRSNTYTISDTNQYGYPIKEVQLPTLPALPINPGVSRVMSFPRKMHPRDLRRQTSASSSSDNGTHTNYLTGQQSSYGQLNPNLLNTTYVTGSISPNKQQQEFMADTTFLASPDSSPPGSPGTLRKLGLGADNVFHRLTNSTTTNAETSIQNGLIRTIREKAGGSQNRSPLIQTHVADGHSKPVLSIHATQDKLFTGAKDATVKVWDLTTGKEIQTLTGHPSSVGCVRYLEDLRLVLSASCCFIKVWDCRQKPTLCVKTLQSTGISNDGSIYFDPNNRMHPLPHGEQNINDITASRRSFTMYTTFGDKVRVWDLRAFSSVGLLSGKHQSQVMCMASEDSTKKEVLITGSKDHTIKVYEFGSTDAAVNISVPSKATLDPPHYDGIESLALSGSMLFSGSRDMCIKKWDLSKFESVNSINGAHNGWITGLTFAPRNDGLLLSSSKDGYVKLWSTETCQQVGKVEAAKGGVCCITRNSNIVFTGAHTGQVGFWRISQSRLSNYLRQVESQNIMTMSTGHIMGMSF